MKQFNLKIKGEKQEEIFLFLFLRQRTFRSERVRKFFYISSLLVDD